MTKTHLKERNKKIYKIQERTKRGSKKQGAQARKAGSYCEEGWGRGRSNLNCKAKLCNSRYEIVLHGLAGFHDVRCLTILMELTETILYSRLSQVLNIE